MPIPMQSLSRQYVQLYPTYGNLDTAEFGAADGPWTEVFTLEQPHGASNVQQKITAEILSSTLRTAIMVWSHSRWRNRFLVMPLCSGSRGSAGTVTQRQPHGPHRWRLGSTLPAAYCEGESETAQSHDNIVIKMAKICDTGERHVQHRRYIEAGQDTDYATYLSYRFIAQKYNKIQKQ